MVRITLCGLTLGIRTDVPAVIGIVISNTMIFAVNVVASGTIDVGGHSILPTFK